jgi:LEA14-like dessication related protein
MRFAVVVFAIGMAVLQGCAGVGKDPLKVTVAGFEPLAGEGMELRMLVKLRVQNPNDKPIDYKGLALEMNVRGKSFATGVGAERGTVPAFGETVVAVPVTVSAMRMMQQAFSLMSVSTAAAEGGPIKLPYEMKGKLAGQSLFGTMHFSTKGEFEMPTASDAPEAPA